MRSGSLCALLWRLLSWCHPRKIILRARHIPGRLNVIADKLSPHNQVIQTEWCLSQQVFNRLCSNWVQPQIDLFASRFNHKLPKFVSPVPDSTAWAVDALSLSWSNLDVYAFPPVSLLSQVISKLVDQDQDDINRSGLAQHALVLGSDQSVKSDSLQSSLREEPVDPTVQRPSPQELESSKFACLAPRTSSIRRQGFSEEVAARIEALQRSSTRAVYKSKWAIFVKWCESNQVDFRSPSLKQVADFLLYLFKERNLQPSTIEGYRTAIADMVGNDLVQFGKDESLTRLLDSFHRDKPKGRQGVPAWNLSLVLHQLTKAPFEPMRKASLKHLTFKTVFLLALGSGKKRNPCLVIPQHQASG